jgi:hypothetical protein
VTPEEALERLRAGSADEQRAILLARANGHALGVTQADTRGAV